MLSDSLFDAHYKLCKDIHHYCASIGADYPNAQKANFIRTLYYLDMTRAGYDEFGDDDKKKTKEEKKVFMIKAKKDYADALNGRYMDSAMH